MGIIEQGRHSLTYSMKALKGERRNGVREDPSKVGRLGKCNSLCHPDLLARLPSSYFSFSQLKMALVAEKQRLLLLLSKLLSWLIPQHAIDQKGGRKGERTESRN